MADALALHDGKLIATNKGILLVDDAADEPCCWCVRGCAWIIAPKTVEVTVSDVWQDTGADPPAPAESCEECDNYEGVFELPLFDQFGVPLPCQWEDTFTFTCTRPLSAFPNVCDVHMRIEVGVGACINGDGDCEVYVTAKVTVVIQMATCDPAVIGLSSSSTANFGEDGAGCGNNCTVAGEKRKRLSINPGADCQFVDIRGESITIDQCDYAHAGHIQPTCFSDGGGSITIQF